MGKMKILAIDVGTGTQDILLLDTELTVENCVQMVMPSPTAIAGNRVRKATMEKNPIIFSGTNMGGGPVTDAVKLHLESGYKVYSTPEAAVTFDDDIEVVKSIGVTIVSEEEAEQIKGNKIYLSDLDTLMIKRALESFDVNPTWDILAVAVFDHGNAPPGYSDRKFRFDHLLEQVTSGSKDVNSFAYLKDEIPEYLTRMIAVSNTALEENHLLLMDTAEAAIIGSLEDNLLNSHHCKVVANIGNEHTLAFHLHDNEILGIFEHHTHLLSKSKLETYLENLVTGELDGDAIWKEQGHGAIVISGKEKIRFLSIIGPMRNLLRNSRLNPYFATPHGSMMLAGPFGLVKACGDRFPEFREEIKGSLNKNF